MHWKAFRHILDIIMRRSRNRAIKSFYKPLVDLNNQTRQLEDGSRICNYLRNDKIVKRHYTDVRTLYDAIRRGARLSEDGMMLGSRNINLPDQPYEWVSYSEVIKRSITIAHAFRALDLPIGQQTCIGIYSKNQPEWIIIEHATYAFSNVLVPLYETSGAEACAFIVNQAEIQLVVCDTLDKAKALLEHHQNCPKLKYIVVMDSNLPIIEVKKAETMHGVTLMTLIDLERLGAQQPSIELCPPKSTDLATICYTSGTTGVPKGVMLTHGNIIADGTTLDFFKNVSLNSSDVMMSFLPLAHMFERVVQSVIYMEGGRVGFYSGDIKTLPDDIKTLQPTFMPVVPRVLNRIHDKVMIEVNKSKFKKILFETVMKHKMHELHNGIICDHFWDRIVFGKIRESMGGRLKLMITGSAPLSEEVLDFVRASLGCVVVEGYGQTEAVACVSITLEGDSIPGHVGVPSPCNVVKLVDVPELGYFAKDSVGEICVRGANIFRGYCKNEEETNNVLDKDGWLHTGDIGHWTERGTLKVVDRKKNIFKLSQGEYVSSEQIEDVYGRSKYVLQSFVHGESLKSCLVAIIVPDPEVLLPKARELGLDKLSMKELCENKIIKELIFNDLIETGTHAKLNSFEQVKDIYLSAEQFSVQDQLLTPTLKNKRPQIKSFFAKQIDSMYEKLN